MQNDLRADPRLLFAELLGAQEAALLIDDSGLVLAGAYYESTGNDLGADVSAALSGISGEVERATRHLELGPWRSISFETEAANVNLSPVAGTDGMLLLVAGAPEIPLGAFRRTVIRCGNTASAWCAEELGA